MFINLGILKADPEFPLANLSIEKLRQELPRDNAVEDDDDGDWEHLVGTHEHVQPANAPTEADENLLSTFENLDFEDEELENALALFSPQDLPAFRALKEQIQREMAKLTDASKNEETPPPEMETSQKVADPPLAPVKSADLLKQKAKSPSVIWQQNDEVILLQIKIGDVEEYFLEISSKELVFQMLDLVDNEVKALAFAFYGVVDVARTSFEKRGLNLVVRLAKVGHHEWPRLLEMEERLMYVKYNYDHLNVIDDHIEFKKERPRRIRADDSDDDNDEDSSNSCVDEDEDDMADPLSDPFIKKNVYNA